MIVSVGEGIIRNHWLLFSQCSTNTSDSMQRSMPEPKFTEGAEVEGWGSINVFFRRPIWMASLAVEHIDDRGRSGYLRFSVEGNDPDEARARLERALDALLTDGWPHTWPGSTPLIPPVSGRRQPHLVNAYHMTHCYLHIYEDGYGFRDPVGALRG